MNVESFVEAGVKRGGGPLRDSGGRWYCQEAADYRGRGVNLWAEALRRFGVLGVLVLAAAACSGSEDAESLSSYSVRHEAPDGSRAHIAVCAPNLVGGPVRLHKLRSPDGKVVTIWAVRCHEA